MVFRAAGDLGVLTSRAIPLEPRGRGLPGDAAPFIRRGIIDIADL